MGRRHLSVHKTHSGKLYVHAGVRIHFDMYATMLRDMPKVKASARRLFNARYGDALRRDYEGDNGDCTFERAWRSRYVFLTSKQSLRPPLEHAFDDNFDLLQYTQIDFSTVQVELRRKPLVVEYAHVVDNSGSIECDTQGG